MALIIDTLPGIAEKIPGGQVLVTSLDWLLNWSRANSLWPLSFGTKCCAIEMLMATGASHQDLSRFGAAARSLAEAGIAVSVCVLVGLGGLAAGGTLGNLMGRMGQRGSEKLPLSGIKTLNLILTPIAGAIILGLIGQLVEWLYQIGEPKFTLWGPVAVGAAAGLFFLPRAARTRSPIAPRSSPTKPTSTSAVARRSSSSAGRRSRCPRSPGKPSSVTETKPSRWIARSGTSSHA